MRKIELTQSKVALVDDWEYERINKYKWYALLSNNTYYVVSGSSHIYMHHLILSQKPGFQIDHRDGNGLNNQKHNLRYCTSSQNKMNQKPRSGLSSKYKGVYWSRHNRNWKATIMLNRKSIKLGGFKTEKEAALVYNCAALQHFGEFARLNVVNSPINREELLEKLIKMEGKEDARI